MKYKKFKHCAFVASLELAVLTVGLLSVSTAQAGCSRWDITCKDSWIRQRGRQIDPTNPDSDTRRILRENDPTSPAFAENQWGNAGGAGYPAAAQWMRANNGRSQGLDENQKKYLRPHFGDLVDRVVVIYNANLMDEWSAFSYRINLGHSAAQTYCNRIYVDNPYQPNNRDQLVLLAHELTHSKQCEQLGGEGKFGFHYFREYKRAGQNYENNKLEKEAFAFEEQFAGWLNKQLAQSNNKKFAAIAVSQQTGKLGWSWGSSSQAEAEKGAVQACNESDCKSIMWVQNAYAAIAYGEDSSWGASWGKSQQEANQNAIQSCQQVAQNPQSYTVVKVVESTQGTIVNNPLLVRKTATQPNQQPTQQIAALDPQWKYSVFLYEDKRYGGQGKFELKKINNGVIAEQTTGKGESYTYSLLEGKPDYIIVSTNLSPDNNYYIKLYSNGNAE